MTPFVLRDCRELPPEPGPSGDQEFDRRLQLWVCKESGLPLVLSMQARDSTFGETTITETREGVDQPDTSNMSASQFGETTITRSDGEGADQPFFSDLSSSQFGETTRLRVTELAAQATLLDDLASQFGETTLTKTQEGVDQPEIFALFETDMRDEAL
jgi:hypothetical protein